ncbi:hypothetical protein V6N13_051207 [Hibiscus sabdariffa]
MEEVYTYKLLGILEKLMKMSLLLEKPMLLDQLWEKIVMLGLFKKTLLLMGQLWEKIMMLGMFMKTLMLLGKMWEKIISVNADSNDITTDTTESDEESNSESEDFSADGWLSDETDEEITEIFDNKRTFKNIHLGDEQQVLMIQTTMKLILNGRFVGKHFLGKLKILPNLKLKDMMRLAKQELKVELNKNVCHRARIWANKKIKERLKDEFNKLFDYTYALREADPNGTFDLFVQRPTPFANTIFRRLHVCFGGLNGGFKKYCRPVLSLDGCYLKGGFKGEILAVVGRMGLLEEIRMILPNVEHIFCARHMYANWKKGHIGHDMQQVFWACYKATIKVEFHKHSARMATMKGTALSSLLKRDPKNWSKVSFETHSKCDAVDNNFGEAFNSTIISPSRPGQMIVRRPNTRSKFVTMSEPLIPSQSAPLSQQSESTHPAPVNQHAVMSIAPSTSSNHNNIIPKLLSLRRPSSATFGNLLYLGIFYEHLI